MHYQCKNPEDLLKTIKDEKIEMIDLRFTDIPGLWQHFSVPPRALDENAIVEGVGFDGSSIRGFQEIQAICWSFRTRLWRFSTHLPKHRPCPCLQYPRSGDRRELQPRRPLCRAKGRNLPKGDRDRRSYFGPELEHFVFNEVRYDQGTNYGFYEINAQEANWDAANGNGPSFGHKLRPKEGYFPVPPADTLQDTRTEMVLLL